MNYTHCDLDRDHLTRVVDAAIDLWNSIPTAAIRLERGSEDTSATFASVSTATSSSVASEPIIFCDPSYGSNFHETNPGSELGKTFSTDAAPHTIADYIGLNADASSAGNIYLPAYGASDETFIGVIAHEMGHVLGLGHSGDPNSIMSYDHELYSSKLKARIAQDDVDGISFLYPRKELGADKVFGCSKASASTGMPLCDDDAGPFLDLLGMFGIAGFALLARRRRAT